MITGYTTNNGNVVLLTLQQITEENSRLRKENLKAAQKILGPYSKTQTYWKKISDKLDKQKKETK